jgi:predicted GTPase
MLGKIQSLDGRTQSGNRLTECSLFVCNKWDQIDENERDEVKKHVAKQLRQCWESANLNKQIVYISTKNAKTARKYGGVTAEYNELIQKLKHAILRAIKKRLYDHWL